MYERLNPWSDQFISTHVTVYGSVAHPVGLLCRLLGRDDEAEGHFAEAHAVNARMNAPFFTAFTDVAWAACGGSSRSR